MGSPTGWCEPGATHSGAGEGSPPALPLQQAGKHNPSQQGPLQPSSGPGGAAGMHQRDKGARHSQSQSTGGPPWVCGPPELSPRASSPPQGHTPCHTHGRPQSSSWLSPATWGRGSQIRTHLDHDAWGLREIPKRDPKEADERSLGLVCLRAACAQDAPTLKQGSEQPQCLHPPPTPDPQPQPKATSVSALIPNPQPLTESRLSVCADP